MLRFPVCAFFTGASLLASFITSHAETHLDRRLDRRQPDGAAGLIHRSSGPSRSTSALKASSASSQNWSSQARTGPNPWGSIR